MGRGAVVLLRVLSKAPLQQRRPAAQDWSRCSQDGSASVQTTATGRLFTGSCRRHVPLSATAVGSNERCRLQPSAQASTFQRLGSLGLHSIQMVETNGHAGTLLCNMWLIPPPRISQKKARRKASSSPLSTGHHSAPHISRLPTPAIMISSKHILLAVFALLAVATGESSFVVVLWRSPCTFQTTAIAACAVAKLIVWFNLSPVHRVDAYAHHRAATALVNCTTQLRLSPILMLLLPYSERPEPPGRRPRQRCRPR